MMSWIFVLMILFSIVFGALNGRIDQVSIAAIQECSSAIQLVITLIGSICLWSGLMKVAEESKLTEKVSQLLAPIIRLIFKGLDPSSAAAKAISMNMTANMLGLGNAATPLGLKAMGELQKLSGDPATASNHMVLFVVLNTASIQLVPTSTAILRLAAGSKTPLDILPCVWIASVVSVIGGICVAKILQRITPSQGRFHQLHQFKKVS